MSVIVLADLRGKGGSVTKDTVVGGYGSRFRGDSVTTRLAKNVRRVFLNIPSIHIAYLASIFSALITGTNANGQLLRANAGCRSDSSALPLPIYPNCSRMRQTLL